MKMIIRENTFLGCYEVTTKENYYSVISNARKIQRLKFSDFSSVEEVIEYYCKYFKSKPEDFEVIG